MKDAGQTLKTECQRMMCDKERGEIGGPDRKRQGRINERGKHIKEKRILKKQIHCRTT